jgi:hypothetical protein
MSAMTRMTSSFAGLSDSIWRQVYDAGPLGNGGVTAWSPGGGVVADPAAQPIDGSGQRAVDQRAMDQ